jgi:thiol-disulfide isomerase/thioredoxin
VDRRAPLSELHAEANRLIQGGPRAFTALLHRLRGYPIVINEWASWCPNCVFEFPAFQRMATKYGSRVAFVGVDVEADDDQAAAFLRKFPVTYPSYVDPDQSVARSLEASGGYP